jgi:hypothetical protein
MARLRDRSRRMRSERETPVYFFVIAVDAMAESMRRRSIPVHILLPVSIAREAPS